MSLIQATPVGFRAPLARHSRSLTILLSAVLALLLTAGSSLEVAARPLTANAFLRSHATASDDIIPATSSRILYRGAWRQGPRASQLGGQARFTRRQNASASLRFTGSQVLWFGRTGPKGGTANVFIDGRRVRTVNTYSAKAHAPRLLFRQGWSRLGEHRIKITMLSRTGRQVSIEGIVVRRSTRTVAASDGASRTASREAWMTLSPDEGRGGARTVLDISGFPGRSKGRITWDGSASGMPSFTTTASGTARLSVSVPDGASRGYHQLGARDAKGRILIERTFEILDGASSAGSGSSTPDPAPTQRPTVPTGEGPSSTPAPTPRPTPAPTPRPTPAPTPRPETPSDTGTYDAVFTGDATGRTDVTSALASFLSSHSGDHVALASGGTYRVSSVGFTASNMTVDFRGSRLVGTTAQAHGILRISNGRNVTINDPYLVGTGYAFDWDLQNEHGIWIDGGSSITINRPVTRDTHGDGIYIGYRAGTTAPASDVLIVNPDIQRASRNGIAPVAGEVTVRGGSINHVGIIGIDFEPNDSTGAASISGTIDGVDIRNHGEFPGYSTDYAIAAAGKTRATKAGVRVMNVTGDYNAILIMDAAVAVVRDSSSERSATAEFTGSSSVTFSGNTRISRQ